MAIVRLFCLNLNPVIMCLLSLRLTRKAVLKVKPSQLTSLSIQYGGEPHRLEEVRTHQLLQHIALIYPDDLLGFEWAWKWFGLLVLIPISLRKIRPSRYSGNWLMTLNLLLHWHYCTTSINALAPLPFLYFNVHSAVLLL